MAKKRREKRRKWLVLFLIMALSGVGVSIFHSGRPEDKTAETGIGVTRVDRWESQAGSRKAIAVNAARQETKLVYASGEAVGIYIKTDGVLVLGTQAVRTKNNQSVSPAENKLCSGDYILEMNNKAVTSKAELISFLQENGEKEIVLTIQRNGEVQQVKMEPVYSVEEDCYQIGVWIRDDTQGIGTVTYITEDGSFGALGHGINDSNLGVEMDISGGSIYRTDIASIMKGRAEHPGEVIGSINYIPENYLGNITKNTSCGIFGEIRNSLASFQNGDKMEIADKSEIKTGEALIRTSISGESEDYTIKITKVSANKKMHRRRCVLK
ncbi:MAG: PDZ domain-containing protein [Clostridiales bacterium]|nr:PDZ domain-containing protein [Clostridiales bacterium]